MVAGMVQQFAGPMIENGIGQAEPAAVDDALATLAALCIMARSDDANPDVRLVMGVPLELPEHAATHETERTP